MGKRLLISLVLVALMGLVLISPVSAQGGGVVGRCPACGTVGGEWKVEGVQGTPPGFYPANPTILTCVGCEATFTSRHALGYNLASFGPSAGGGYLVPGPKIDPSYWRNWKP